MMKEMLKKINIYEYMAEKIIRYFDKKIDLSQKELEKLYLGVMVILLNVFKMLFVCVAAFFIGVFKETVVLIAMFAVIRINAAGIHLKSNLQCTAACLIAYLGSALAAINHPLKIKTALWISIILIGVICKYSPADTESRPILGRENRKKLRLRTVKVSILLLIGNLIILDKLVFNLFMYALFIQAMCVSPFTYKVVGMKYYNYKEFEL